MVERRIALPVEVDLANAAKIKASLDLIVATGAHRVVVDCTELAFIDSSGIRVLVDASQTLERRSHQLVLVNVSGSPRRAFDLLGLEPILRYDSEIEAAVGGLRLRRG